MIPHTSTDILLTLIAYLLGSLPSGLWMSRLFGLADPRTVGSQGTGATNVLRGGHKLAAGLTLFLDVLKGAVTVMIAELVDPSFAPFAGLVAVIGHIWPLWLGFRGGKGVGPACGVLLVLSWPVAVICFVTWISVAFVTRYSSLASIVTVCLSPFYAIYLDTGHLTVLCIGLAGLLLWTHRDNIKRLSTGREPHIGDTSPPPSDA